MLVSGTVMWKERPCFTLIFVSCLIHYGSTLTRIDPLVDSKVGLIRGLRASDGDYSMFMGIPYATVNASNPFGPATPHSGFDDTFEAYDDSAICPQVEEFENTIVGSLDCLHINIYVPNSANSRNRLPVLVWIHGGAFSYGFAGKFLYGPRYLVKQDVLLVTFNYRLGPYGFMCLDTPDIPGNQGLKDQQLALRWIKNNIEAFGGDSNQITIFGESAGGVSVDFHMIYSQEILFNKAIMQSGVSLAPWAVLEPDTLAPLKLAQHLGFPTEDIKEALQFLTSIDSKLVIASSTELNLIFRPCVEKDFDEVEKFIYDYPVNIRETSIGNIPILLGYNSDESMSQWEKLTSEDYAKINIFYDILTSYFNIDSETLIEMETQLRQFYIGDEPFSEDVKEELIAFDSDFIFNYPTVRSINKYLDNGANRIYYYLFSYDSKRNFVKDRLNLTSAGVTHADEISYFFDVSYMENPSEEDQVIIDRVTTLWTNFVKYGNPTPEVTDLLPVQWPTVTKDILYYLNIDSEMKVAKRNFKDRMAFWNLFYKINEKYQLGYNDNNK